MQATSLKNNGSAKRPPRPRKLRDVITRWNSTEPCTMLAIIVPREQIRTTTTNNGQSRNQGHCKSYDEARDQGHDTTSTVALLVGLASFRMRLLLPRAGEFELYYYRALVSLSRPCRVMLEYRF